MELQFYQAKAKVMGIDQIKERLHLRIEQADEKLLRVLDQFAETLFAEYHSDESKPITDEQIMAIPPSPNWRKMSREELRAELDEANAEYERGEYVTLEELEKESETW